MSLHIRQRPERIVCLTEEPTEILYLLGEERRVVGISAYTCRPPEAREKPIVSAFVGGSVEKIRALEPDLIIGFSDIQAELARKLIAAGLQVLIFNQRTLQEIVDVILIVGRLVGAETRAEAFVHRVNKRFEEIRVAGQELGRRPRVYFEEWDDPMISAIRWVSELIEIAGGEDIFAERSRGSLAKDRFVQDDEVLQRRPELMIASWCGKPLVRESVLARPGWDRIPAIASGELHEMDPSIILQPGPACLTDGLEALHGLIRRVAEPRA